jgi:sphingolipid 4-desaturase/C4-monooxygenase
MPSPAADFAHSDAPEPHRERGRRLFRDHPEARALNGPNPASFLLILLVVGLQTGIAFLLREQPWWAALLVAYLAGAVANHALFVLIHETSHNLVFRSTTANVLAGIVADLPNLVPISVSFRLYHLKHHVFQGDYGLDADLPSRWEARLVGTSFVRKAIWLFLFPVFQVLRPLRLREIRFATPWTFVSWATAIAYVAAIAVFLGPVAILYLATSFFFSVGFHPLGARWIQEHYLVAPPQETYSYYGPANVVALNVGYHNEHHDAPSVAWNRLPAVRRAAPELYDSLVSHASWTRLFWRFLTDRNLSLWSRVVRENRGGIPAAAETA